MAPYFYPDGTIIYNYLDLVWKFTLGRKKHKPLFDIEKRGFIDFYTEMIEGGYLLKGFTPLRLRDTYINWLSKLGVTPLTLSVLLGYEIPTSLKYYEEELTATENIEAELLGEIHQAGKYGGFNVIDGEIAPRNPTKANDQSQGG
jgi:hypothetical protein